MQDIIWGKFSHRMAFAYGFFYLLSKKCSYYVKLFFYLYFSKLQISGGKKIVVITTNKPQTSGDYRVVCPTMRVFYDNVCIAE
jgi:hypothetical protein